jgi:hypothetical protein
LALIKDESVTVIKDMLDRWHILGDVNECKVEDVRPTFEEAIREADFKVKLLGGRGYGSLARRAEFKKFEKPTPAQVTLCKRLRIDIPPGASKAEVSQKMSVEIRQRKQLRAQRKVA